MAISSQDARVVHTGNGVTTFFSYAPIEGVTAANLKVWLFNPTTGVLTPQTLTTHYTFGSGGITFLSAPASGVRVILRREVPFTQPDIYTTNTPFPAKVTENRLDQIVMATQELRDDVLTRAIRLPLGDAGFSGNVLPAVEARKEKVLGFDISGDPTVYDVLGVTTPVTSWVKTWLSTSTSAASGRANLGATTVGDALFTAASASAARAILGATTIGDALFTAASDAAARTALDAAASGPVGSSDITMNTNRLLGRWASGSGPIQEVSVGPGLSLSGGVLDAVSGGATFLALADTPAAYTGAADRAVFVNNAATALEFATPASARDRLGLTPFSLRNFIINGNFDFWQRGVSGSNGYLADRWDASVVGSSVAQSRQSFTLGQTDVPYEPRFFHRSVVTSMAGASNRAVLLQRVEGVRTLAGQQAVLSFYAKADASRPIAVEFGQFFGTGGSPSSPVEGVGVTTCNLTTSWQRFTIPVTLPSISGKTVGTNNNDLLLVGFWFDAGSSFNSRTNSLGHQSGTFDIAQVQLEPGTIATPFEVRPPALELTLCQRYYERWQAPASGAVELGSSSVRTSPSPPHPQGLPLRFAVEKRATPTVISSEASSFSVGGAVCSSVSFGCNNRWTAWGDFQASSGNTGGNWTAIHINMLTNGFIAFDAEL